MGSGKKLAWGVMMLLGWVCASKAGAVTYRLRDIGTLGGYSSYVQAINAAGDVVGYSFTATDGTNAHAFLYRNGTLYELGQPFGGYTVASAINNSGQIAGTGDYLRNSHGFIYNNGSVTDLLPYGLGSAAAINSSGQVAGSGAHGLLYSSGAVTDLGTLGGPYSTAWAMNDAAQVVGSSTISPDSVVTHAFLYSNGVMSDIGTLGGTYASAGGINATGTMIVGTSWTVAYQPGGPNTKHAFLYTNAMMHDLGMLGGSSSGAGGTPNSNGEFTGWAEVPGGASHAFLYTSGVMKDLNTMLDPSGSGWALTAAYGINDAGWITGYGIAPGGNTHGFLLTPTPEPSVVGVICLMMMSRRRRRR